MLGIFQKKKRKKNAVGSFTTSWNLLHQLNWHFFLPLRKQPFGGLSNFRKITAQRLHFDKTPNSAPILTQIAPRPIFLLLFIALPSFPTPSSPYSAAAATGLRRLGSGRFLEKSLHGSFLPSVLRRCNSPPLHLPASSRWPRAIRWCPVGVACALPQETNKKAAKVESFKSTNWRISPPSKYARFGICRRSFRGRAPLDPTLHSRVFAVATTSRK